MKFKKAVSLHALIVCASLNILQGPLFANDPQNALNTQEEDDTSFLVADEENQAANTTKKSTSFFSNYKKSMVIGGGVLVAAGVIAGLYAWKNDQDKSSSNQNALKPSPNSSALPTSTQSTSIEDLQKAVGTINITGADKPRTEYNLQPDLLSLNLCVKKAQQTLTESGSSVAAKLVKYDPLQAKAYHEQATKEYEKAFQAHTKANSEYCAATTTYDEAVKNLKLQESDGITGYTMPTKPIAPVEPEPPQAIDEMYTEVLADNSLFEQFRKDIETVLSQSSDITKEQLRFLTVTFIHATQTCIKNDRAALVKSFMRDAENEKDENKDLRFTLLDSLSDQSAEEWADLLERIVSNGQLEHTIKPQLEAYEKKVKAWDESIKTSLQGTQTDTEGFQLLHGVSSSFVSGQIPESLKEAIKEIPMLSILFPELKAGTLPSLLQPFFTFLAHAVDRDLQKKLTANILTTEACQETITGIAGLLIVVTSSLLAVGNPDILFKRLLTEVMGLTKAQFENIVKVEHQPGTATGAAQ